jgi:hypothetical protein
MRSRIGIAFCMLALLQIIGGHWAVLQTTAWIGMIFQYSQHGGIRAGLTETFDGAHPCSLCRAIKAGNKKEQNKAPLLQAAFKKDLLAEENGFEVQRTGTEQGYSWCDERMESVVFSPAVPPPRML